jgi:uncharacterized membrane protein YeaQ/YmgE (transglycosylase-associated protein family)
MYLLIWISAGWLAGWLTGKSLEGEGFGPSMDIAMGIAGALIGGVLMRSLGFLGYAGTAFATLVAVSCAVLLTTLMALSHGRKIHTRQF